MPSANKPGLEDYPRVEVTSREALRAWLETHHQSASGIWLVTYKKGASQPRVEYNDIVEELLCVGWVDSKPATVDAERTRLLCTPRKPTSAWSKANKDRVEKLLAAGLMRPRGLEMVALAKERGTWNKLDDADALREPPDLAAQLDAVPAARKHWNAFPPSARRGILEWIVQAKQPDTRARRVEQTATLAARNERANQWRKK